MTSPKLLLVLMAVASTLAAPQINERQVVGDVLSQLQPAIAQALASMNLGSSSSFSSSSPAVSVARFASAPRSSFSAGSRSFSGGTGAAKTSFSSFPSSPSSSSASVSSLTSSVVSSLQPSIAAAVAQALAGSRRSSSSMGDTARATGSSAEPNYGPAQYDFSYKVSDDDSQSYMAQQETREGLDVTGTYNFVDPTGSLVTVNYKAGPEGYSETREVEKGAVVMRNIPGAWTGPMAGIDDVKTTSPIAAKQNSGLSQSDLIAQILSAIQPKINSAVQSAISSSPSSSSSSFSSGVTTRASAPRQNNFASTRGAGSSFSSDQNSIIASVISSLQPRISSAVNSAISYSRPVTVARPRISIPVRAPPQRANNGNLVGLFGAQGENNVRIETPEFNIQY